MVRCFTRCTLHREAPLLFVTLKCSDQTGRVQAVASALRERLSILESGADMTFAVWTRG